MVSVLRKRAVIEALGELFEGEELKRALTGVDTIGDLAVIKIPRGWEGRKHEIGELVLSKLKNVRGVFRQTAAASGWDKVRGIEWLAGEKETVTTYAEHGCVFKVDIAKVYFSPRLSYERLRVARLAKRSEVVVNMFAGVGTFSIAMAKIAGSQRIYSIDKNPEAFKYMAENVVINGMSGTVIPILGDAKEAVVELRGVADRVLMPLPELALEYLPYGISCLKPRGWIHIYLHRQGGSRGVAVEDGVTETRRRIEETAEIQSISGRIVRSVGRRLYQVVVDAEVQRMGDYA
jgi:tRNA (guanine37-N1)-methyltransferase